MTPLRLPPRFNVWLWQSVWLCLVAVPIAIGIYYVWHKHQWAQGVLEQTPPRAARLAGLLQSQADILKRQETVQSYINTHAYPATTTVSEAGNDAQQRVRQVFADAGFTIASVQVQEVQTQGRFNRIPLSMRIEGNYNQVVPALQNLDTLRPVVIMDELRLDAFGITRPDAHPRVTGEIKLSVLLSRP